MPDPIYVFKPGEGWIPQTPVQVTMRCGTVVQIELRKPNPGEKFRWTDATHPKWQYLSAWIEPVQQVYYNNLPTIPTGYPKNSIFCTIVRL